MKIFDRVCPNLVGGDIGCGVDLIKLTCGFEDSLQKLDEAVRSSVPAGTTIHKKNIVDEAYFKELLCWGKLDEAVRNGALRSMGTLGGGNHFIEAYEDGHICVHSGSRHIGTKVAQYYQSLAIKRCAENMQAVTDEFRDGEKQFVPKELAWLTGEDMAAYLHDVEIMQKFAFDNRMTIVKAIAKYLGENIHAVVAASTHNYIDTKNMILRKGAISAQRDEIMVIPLNMRDGVIVCKGKGNEDWNYSAPHGAGRLYSRAKSKELFTLEEFAESMKGIYSTSISKSTLSEAPFAYKDQIEIKRAIEPSVEIMYALKPIYNFKA